MKDQILKIAGVKSEKEFYKKFPTEKAFMAKHGKELKKAAMGTSMVKEQLSQLTDFGNPPIAQNGFNFADTLGGIKQNLAKSQQITPQKESTLDSIMNVGSQLSNVISEASTEEMKKGGYLPIAQGGGMFNIANAISGAFTTPGKAATATSAGTPASGGLGDTLGNIFGGAGGAKGIMQGGQDIFKGGFKSGMKSLGTSAGLGAAGKAAGMGMLNAAPQILQGIGQMKEQKQQIKKADQMSQLSGLTAQAAESRPEQQRRKYVRPEDSLVQPGQLGNPQGTGTNYLAEYGARIGGNPTQVQNTYAPKNTLYDDLGYTPLNNQNVKQFAYGGKLQTAEFGDYFQDSGQASIGKGVGSAIGGAFFGKPGEMIGGFLGGIGGNLLGGAADANKLANFQDTTRVNTERAAWASGAQNIQSQNAAYMEDGGWVSNDWQPQVIAKFGDYSMQDLLKPPTDADMLRAGGHLKEYTNPSAAAMYTGRNMEYGGQMAMGGDLQVHRGKAELMSYNPYLPDGGETVMFRGPSHENGGMPINYGENGVEVEGGEPAVKLADGGQDENLVVFGNMVIPKYGVDELGDKKASGKKFKNYVADLSKVEARQNKIIDKSTELANTADANDPFEQLTLNSSKLNLLGANMKLKDIAQKKQTAAMVQNAILDTAKENGLESDALAKGKIVKDKNSNMAKFGTKLNIAQNGSVVDYLKGAGQKSDFASRKALAKEMGIANYSGTAKQNMSLLEKLNTKSSDVYVPPTPVELTDNRGPNYNWETFNQPLTRPTGVKSGYDQYGNYFDEAGKVVDQSGALPGITPIPQKDKFDWQGLGMGIGSNLANIFRPQTTSPLDPTQTMGEMYALGSNQQDPVYAQTYQPMLDTPYDISLQDQINAVDSQARAAILAARNDPAAQAYIMSQAADAKTKVLGEQMRINQGQKAQVYQANRAAINDAALKNLGILDQQQVRQSQAKSATKAQAIEALNSIADKITRNKLENQRMGVLENMYGFRFSPSGRVYNTNNPVDFNLEGAAPAATLPTVDAKAAKDATKKKRNGDIVKALKNL